MADIITRGIQERKRVIKGHCRIAWKQLVCNVLPTLTSKVVFFFKPCRGQITLGKTQTWFSLIPNVPLHSTPPHTHRQQEIIQELIRSQDCLSEPFTFLFFQKKTRKVGCQRQGGEDTICKPPTAKNAPPTAKHGQYEPTSRFTWILAEAPWTMSQLSFHYYSKQGRLKQTYPATMLG